MQERGTWTFNVYKLSLISKQEINKNDRQQRRDFGGIRMYFCSDSNMNTFSDILFNMQPHIYRATR